MYACMLGNVKKIGRHCSFPELLVNRVNFVVYFLVYCLVYFLVRDKKGFENTLFEIREVVKYLQVSFPRPGPLISF